MTTITPTACVDSIETLKNLVIPQQNTCFWVLGYDSPGDGGGGHFYWDANSIDDPYQGIFIKTKLLQNGRWKRLMDGPVSVKWFGAKGDGVNDDHDAIQLAIDFVNIAAIRYGKNKNRHDYFPREVYLPAGTYLVGKSINVGSCTIRGEFATSYEMDYNSSVIKPTSTFNQNAVISSYKNNDTSSNNNAPCQLLNLIIDADEICKYAVHLIQANGTLTIISNVWDLNAKEHGFYFQKCQGATFERLWAQFNSIGIVAEDCNASRFVNCRVEFNRTHGMFIKRVKYSAGCRIDNLDAELNCGHGLIAQDVSYLQAKNCWLEQNRDDGIRLEKCDYAVIEGARISENQGADYYNNYEDIDDKRRPNLRHLKQFKDYLNAKIDHQPASEKIDRCIRLFKCTKSKVFNCCAAKTINKEYLNIREEKKGHIAGNDLKENNWIISSTVANQHLPVEEVIL